MVLEELVRRPSALSRFRLHQGYVEGDLSQAIPRLCTYKEERTLPNQADFWCGDLQVFRYAGTFPDARFQDLQYRHIGW